LLGIQRAKAGTPPARNLLVQNTPATATKRDSVADARGIQREREREKERERERERETLSSKVDDDPPAAFGSPRLQEFPRSFAFYVYAANVRSNVFAAARGLFSTRQHAVIKSDRLVGNTRSSPSE